MSTIVNSVHLWRVLPIEAAALQATQAQMASIAYLEHCSTLVEVKTSTFTTLDIEMVEGILSIRLEELDDRFNRVVNGKWLQLAIEEDGYLVLTGDSTKPVTTQPPVTI